MTWFRCMLENVIAACHSILVPARILEHPNKVPAVHGGYNTYRYGHSQHYTHRDHDAELPSNSPFRGLTADRWTSIPQSRRSRLRPRVPRRKIPFSRAKYLSRTARIVNH